MFFHGVEGDFKATETVCTMLDESSPRARDEADVADYRVRDDEFERTNNGSSVVA